MRDPPRRLNALSSSMPRPSSLTLGIPDKSFLIKGLGDHMMDGGDLWFRSLIWSELLIQLPLFLPLAYLIWKGRDWAIKPLIAYSAHVLTTMIPIMTDLYNWHETTIQQKTILLSLYGFWVLVPFLMLVRFLITEDPFGNRASLSGKSKTKSS